MLNIEPHHFEAKFDKTYEQITADDILEKATEFLNNYSDAHGRRLGLPQNLKDVSSLRYITKVQDAFDLTSAPPPGSPIAEQYPSGYSLLATHWYRETGSYNLSSVPVDAHSLLASKAPLPDASRVRWYILLSVRLDTLPFYMPPWESLWETSNTRIEREAYIQRVEAQVEMYADNQNTTSTPTWIALSSFYGLHPSICVPPFAKAYNRFQHPEFVEVEEGGDAQPDGSLPFNMFSWLDEFVAACNAGYLHPSDIDENKFNKGIVKVLRKLLPFLPIQSHTNINRAIEVDWLGNCFTAHGLLCLPFAGVGKKEEGRGGNPIIRILLALQRMFVLLTKYAGVLALTCCPTVAMTVAGTCVHVWLVCFIDRLYGAELFTVNLARHMFTAADDEMHNLAVKFQIVRDLVRELCEFYANVHASTVLPTLPHLRPQPMSLLRCLLPAPDSEVFRCLSDLKLVVLSRVCSEDPAFCLFKGLLRSTAGDLRVYIKFVMSRYGEEAHRLLAGQTPPLAPQLYWCGEIIAGKTMVVMEALSDEWNRRDPHPCVEDKEDIDIVDRDIREALRVLHAQGLVHGDVRQPNIVIARKRGYLIDFDCSGKEGVARYPASLNESVWWARPIRELVRRHMKISDDEARFNRTLDELRGLVSWDVEQSSSLKRDKEDDGGDDKRVTERPRSDDASTDTAAHGSLET